MADPIIVDNKPYYDAADMLPGSPPGPNAVALAAASDNRQSYFARADLMNLGNTCGVYVRLDGHVVRFVIDRASVDYMSPKWQLIARTARRLADSYPALSETAKKALGALKAVVFAAAPDRSYADVGPDIFFYDTDEFFTTDKVTLITASYAASNIVHDAYHVWLHDNDHMWHGAEAEKVCWQLQVDNRHSLQLSSVEVEHLEKLIANPASVDHRINSLPFPQG